MEMRQREEDVEGNWKNGNYNYKGNCYDDGIKSDCGVWRSRVERTEGCDDKKWHKDLQRRAEMMQ